MATITISVNIAETDKNEGDADFRVDIPESCLSYIFGSISYIVDFDSKINDCMNKAVEDYRENNSGN